MNWIKILLLVIVAIAVVLVAAYVLFPTSGITVSLTNMLGTPSQFVLIGITALGALAAGLFIESVWSPVDKIGNGSGLTGRP